ncbi:hypothetical protein BFJ63_vAg17772 [Fusarium oxysporum f. sp. narcissi]|uniref:Uncharacterized protein n=1 Tax=Fusarium oxysporum f. sp. narcissi TaxID=451672 RepID=A0A4Q2UXU1_FUSOX|nr:hypothetical protein BFJ63_vAg17772 [Fusarium oxysporum f. sp. narcissi]
MGDDLVIYYNDSIDSDNLAAAMALFKATCWKPTVRVLWILEPRQVSFGLSMTRDQITRCKELIKQHFPSFENPLKTLLNGDIKQQDIDDIKDLTTDDRKILEMAVKPKYGSINDATLHARLSALDLASCLSEWSNNSLIEVLVDYETLEHIENPVNLHMHHHEELVNRTENELKEYYDILKKVLPFGRRADNLRGWYNKCISRLEHDKKFSDISVERLVLDKVLNRIKTARSVCFFGGSSLRILQQFLDRGVANKIKCHMQVGSCDMSANLFSNQFNIALNQQAAKIVLSRSAEFAEFTVVPSHTAQSIKYSALGLKKFGGHCIEKRILGFNCHEEPVNIVTDQVSLEQQYPDKAYPMPDLTSFLCALVPGHMGSKPGYIEVDEQEGDTLLFKKSSKGIRMFDLDGVKELHEEKIQEIFESLIRGEVTTHVVWAESKAPFITILFPEVVVIRISQAHLVSRLEGKDKSSNPNVPDFLQRFIESKKTNPDLVNDGVIMGYLLVNLLAGADTTAITIRAFFWYTLHSPSAYSKLEKEIMAAGIDNVASFSSARALPCESMDWYTLLFQDRPLADSTKDLEACVREAMRMHPGVCMLLERYVPESGLKLPDGSFVPPGTAVGTNPYVAGRNKGVYGTDADTYRPERWLRNEGETREEYNKRMRLYNAADLTFGGGSRACIGRYLAELELYKIVATLINKYEISLMDPDAPWVVTGSWFPRQRGLNCCLKKRT